MLVAHDDLRVDFRSPVQHGDKIHLETAVARRERPGLHIIPLRDVESHVRKLMPFSVIEEHILGSSRRVAEPVSDIETEGLSLDDPIPGSPVPAVIVGPDSAPPVKRSEVSFTIEHILLPVEFHPAARAHDVDFLIIVEGVLLLLPGSRDDHRIHVRLFQLDPAPEGLSILEIPEPAGDRPLSLTLPECHGEPSVVVADRTAVGARRKIEFSHRKRVEDRLRMFPALFEIKQGYRLQTDIAVVGERERTGEPVIQDKIIVPFLDPHFRRADRISVIDLKQLSGPSGLRERAVLPEQRLHPGHLVISPVHSGDAGVQSHFQELVSLLLFLAGKMNFPLLSRIILIAELFASELLARQVKYLPVHHVIAVVISARP